MIVNHLDTITLSLSKSLSKTSYDRSNAMRKLSTGLKLNAAQDGAAQLSLSNKLDYHISGTDVGTQNVQNMVAKLNTVENQVGNLTNCLQRMRNLAIQALNGIYSPSERSMLNDEAVVLSKETKNIAVEVKKELKPTPDDFVQPVTKLSETQAVAQGYTVIKTATEFKNLINANLAGKYILGNDLDMKELGTVNRTVVDAGTFTGTLEGNGYSIKNLSIQSSDNYTGLIARTSNARIKNLLLEDTTINNSVSRHSFGALVGRAENGTQIDNCGAKNVSINAISSSTGGLVGILTGANSSVKNSYSTGYVNSRSGFVGGLIGGISSAKEVSQSYSTCDVKSVGGNCVGGLVGNSQGLSLGISNCYASGNVSNNINYTGGFIGYSSATPISNSFAFGDVSSSMNYVGGFAGMQQGANISNSYSLGNAKGVNYVGGFAGSLVNVLGSNTVSNCFSKGNAEGVDRVGGFCGMNNNTLTTNSGSDGAVTGTTNVGGFCGTNTAGVNNTNFWNIEKSGITNSSGPAIGYTNDTMPPFSTITNNWNSGLWDFSQSLPQLKVFQKELGLNVQTGSSVGSQYNLDDVGVDYFGKTSMDLSSIGSTGASIERLDDMLNYYNEKRASIGAKINNLTSQIDSNKVRSEKLLSGNSLIKDSDIARETAILAKTQILQNFTTTMLQQNRNLSKNYLTTLYGLN